MPPANFPSLQERETLTTLSKYKRLYENNQFSVLGLHELIKKQYKKEKDIVYISHPIPSRVSDFYGDFVAGETERMVFKATSDEDQELVDEIVFENDLKEKMTDFGTTQSIAGLTWLYLWKDDEEIFHIDEISPDQVFPQQDGSIIVATYKRDPSDALGTSLFLYVQHFRVVGSDTIITRSVWKTDEKGVITQQVGLEVMSKILGRELTPTTTLDGLDELPLRKVSNGKGDKSDYADIIPQLAEINERVTQNSTQFLKNIDAKMQLPAGMKNDEGKVEPFDYILMDGKDQPNASYIINTNPLMADAREHIMHELKIIELATGVPMWALTKGSMPDRVESLRIQMFQAIRKTNRKRAKLKRAIQDMFRMAFKLDGKELEDDISIKFSDVLPTDETAQTNIEVAKTQAGLSSKKSSIMRLEGVSEEEAEKELEAIKEEGVMDGVINPDPLKLQ